jgi:hypothetical protein
MLHGFCLLPEVVYLRNTKVLDGEERIIRMLIVDGVELKCFTVRIFR